MTRDGIVCGAMQAGVGRRRLRFWSTRGAGCIARVVVVVVQSFAKT